MGATQARQNVSVHGGHASGSLLTAGEGPPTSVTGGMMPSNVGSASTLMPSEEDTLPVVFTWTEGGQNVSITGSFTGWQTRIPMVRSGNELRVILNVPRGVHQYKFIVDDQWCVAADQAKTQDSQGNQNNVLDISNYKIFSVTEEAPASRYAQHIPDPNDYTLDPPAIPVVLGKSVYCSTPPQHPGEQVLNMPTNALCDHVYLSAGAGGSTLNVAVTHRYGLKYSTTVFTIKRQRGEADKAAINPLKRAIGR